MRSLLFIAIFGFIVFTATARPCEDENEEGSSGEALGDYGGSSGGGDYGGVEPISAPGGGGVPTSGGKRSGAKPAQVRAKKAKAAKQRAAKAKRSGGKKAGQPKVVKRNNQRNKKQG